MQDDAETEQTNEEQHGRMKEACRFYRGHALLENVSEMGKSTGDAFFMS
jgi:hypothetical protein